MQSQKIFKRDDGSQICITVFIYVPGAFQDCVPVNWRHIIRQKEKYKVKWIDGGEASQEEIFSVKMELWGKLKPVL